MPNSKKLVNDGLEKGRRVSSEKLDCERRIKCSFLQDRRLVVDGLITTIRPQVKTSPIFKHLI